MSTNVLMYCTEICPYCVRAERLLRAKGVVEIEKIRVDLQPESRIAMMEKTRRRTVPQIYIGNHYVGGYDELAALEHSGELAKLLAGE
jgi:glutaredoxin 3